MEIKIYKCEVCGNMTLMIKQGGGTMTCCNKNMVLLKANTSDGATEKHVPVLVEKLKTCDIANASIYNVQVGGVEHPMTQEHYINWIGTFDNESWIIKWLKPGEKPVKKLKITNTASVYEYCNLHGLWKNN